MNRRRVPRETIRSAELRRRRRTAVVVVIGITAGALVSILATSVNAEVVAAIGKYNFSNQAAPVPFGYVKDYGQAFDAARGYGWVQQATSTPVDATLNGRDRNVEADQRTDSFIHMQYCCDVRTGTITPVSWEKVVPPGVYDVTVAVGDATATTATHRITVEGTLAIDNFVQNATSTVMHQTATVRVTVTDGRLTIDANGGKNTKLDYVDIAEVRKEIIGTSPVNGATDVVPSASITLVSEVALDPASLNASTIVVSAGGSAVATAVSLAGDGTTVTVDPVIDLPENAVITVATTGIRSSVNQAVQPLTFTFATSGASPQPGKIGVNASEEFLGVGLRNVYSTVNNDPRAGKPVVISNTGAGLLQVTGLVLSGPQASYFAFDPGQPTSFTLAPGGQLPVNVLFRPTLQQVENYAQLTITSTDPNAPAVVVALTAVNASGYEGLNEPHVSQLTRVLGYTTNIGSENYVVSKSPLPVGDEVISTGWRRVNPQAPVGLVPVAHFSTRTTTPVGSTGWYIKPPGSQVAVPNRSPLHNFEGGTDISGGENQRLFPVPTGSTSFNPGANTFGIYGAYSDFLDDRFNYGKLHNFRTYPVKGPGGVQIPNTWLVILDPTAYGGKNWDYNDYMWLLTNATPDKPIAAAVPYLFNPYSTAAPGTVLDRNGVGTGMTGVEANTAGTQYQPSDITLSGGYLSIVPRAGTSVGSANSLQNGLELAWNATYRNLVRSQVKVMTAGLPIDGVRNSGVAFGPDQDNQARIVLEDSPTGRRLVFDSEEAGVVTPISTVAIDDPASVVSVELRVVGNFTNGTVSAEYRIIRAGQPTPSTFTVAPGIREIYDRMGWWSTDARMTLLANGTTTDLTPVRFDALTLTT